MHLSKTNESFLSRNNKQLFPFRTDPVLTFFAHLAVLCAPWCVERRSCERPGVEHGEFPNRSPARQLSSHFVPTDIQSIRTKIWTFVPRSYQFAPNPLVDSYPSKHSVTIGKLRYTDVDYCVQQVSYAIKALLCVLVTYGEPFVPKISIVSGKTQLLVQKYQYGWIFAQQAGDWFKLKSIRNRY